jgi:hypothetical protein
MNNIYNIIWLSGGNNFSAAPREMFGLPVGIHREIAGKNQRHFTANSARHQRDMSAT